MIKKYFLLLFFSFWIGWSQVPKLDSLKIQLKNSNSVEDSLRNYYQLATLEAKSKQSIYIDSLYEYAKKYNNSNYLIKSLKLKNKFYKYKYDKTKSIFFAKEVLKNSKDTLNILKGLDLIGSTYYYFHNYDSALVYYKRATALVDTNKLKTNKKYYNIISILYGNKGLAYYNKNILNKAIENFIIQSDFAEKDNCVDSKMNALNYLAYSYLRLGQSKKTEKYFLKVIANENKIKNKNYIYNAYKGLGINYGMAGNYDYAIKYITKALNTAKELNDTRQIFDNYNNLSIAYRLNGNYGNSIKFSDSAITIAKSIKDKNLINYAISLKLETLLKLGQFKEVDKFINDLVKNPHNNDIYKLSNIYKTAYKFYKTQNQPQKAVFYLEKWKSYSDSIDKVQRDSKIAEIESQYQAEKKDKEILNLKAEKLEKDLSLNQVRQDKKLLSLGILGAIIVLGVTGFYYKRNLKQKQLIEQLQRELHHRIKNNLATISALIDELKEKFVNQPELIQNLENLNLRINSINQIHQQLYKEADVTNLSMKKYLDKLAGTIKKSFEDKPVIIENQIDEDIKLKADQSLLLGLLVNEFITNSFKHAFDDKQQGKVQIKFFKREKEYILQMLDNGKGLPSDFDILKIRSFGLEIMRLIAKQLKGQFKYDGTKGMKVEIIFPET